MRRIIPAVSALLMLALGACELPPPHIHHPQEFNREAEGFGKEPEDTKEVTICYNTKTATPADVARMARNECAKFGRVARLKGQDALECPLLTPVGARYTCVKPGDDNGVQERGSFGDSWGSGVYPWSYQPGRPLIAPVRPR